MILANSKFKRDNSYRTRFIAEHPPKHGKYRCVYCGRKITKDAMEVDHVVAIGRLKKNWLYRLCVPNGVNDTSNLVPACHGCNHRKGCKGGLWAIRGRYWKICLPVYTAIRVFVVVCIIAIILAISGFQPAVDLISSLIVGDLGIHF